LVQAAVEATSLVEGAYGGRWSDHGPDARDDHALLAALAEKRDLGLRDARIAIEVHLGLRQPSLPGLPATERELAYFLGRAWAECGSCKEADPQRMLARRLMAPCVLGGPAERLRKAREMVGRGARHPTVTSFLNGVRAGFKADGRGRVGTRTAAARRRLIPMLKPLFAECALGPDAATALKDAQLVRLSGLELDVLAELGPLLAAMEEPPRSRAALVRAVAEAHARLERGEEVAEWKKAAEGGASKRSGPAEPDPDGAMRMLERELPVIFEAINGLLRALDLPWEVGLVPTGERPEPEPPDDDAGEAGGGGDAKPEGQEEPDGPADDGPADEESAEPDDPVPRSLHAEPEPESADADRPARSAPPRGHGPLGRLLGRLRIASGERLREAGRGLDMLTPAQRRILLFQV